MDEGRDKLVVGKVIQFPEKSLEARVKRLEGEVARLVGVVEGLHEVLTQRVGRVAGRCTAIEQFVGIETNES